VTALDSDTTLLGNNPKDYASIIQWLSFGNSELIPALGAWLRPLLGVDPYDGAAIAAAREKALVVTEVLEKHLAGSRQWLVGEDHGSVSIADVFVASMLSRGLQFVLGREWRASHPETMTWFGRVVELEWVKGVADVRMCEETVEWIHKAKPNGTHKAVS
jgi:elongation factor 1-gamma